MKLVEEHPEWQRQHAAESTDDENAPGVGLYRRLYRLLRVLPRPAIDAGLADAVDERLRADARRRRLIRALLIGLPVVAVAGLVALVVPLLHPAGRLLAERLSTLPWPLLLAALAALLGGAGLGRRLQRRGRRNRP